MLLLPNYTSLCNMHDALLILWAVWLVSWIVSAVAHVQRYYRRFADWSSSALPIWLRQVQWLILLFLMCQVDIFSEFLFNCMWIGLNVSVLCFQVILQFRLAACDLPYIMSNENRPTIALIWVWYYSHWSTLLHSFVHLFFLFNWNLSTSAFDEIALFSLPW